MTITLREVTPADEPFLREVYASTREDELAMVPWDAAQREAFLKFQFDAQHAHYRSQFPQANFQVILKDGERTGRLYIDRHEPEIRILDITVLPQFRGKGIGSLLMKDLLAESMATGHPLRIWVEAFNPSQTLFRRLGFSVAQEDGFNQLLEFAPTARNLATKLGNGAH